jgi:hypothetical protein
MEQEVSFCYSQEPASCLYPGQDELVVLFNVFFTSFYLLLCLCVLSFFNSYILFFTLIEYVYMVPLLIMACPSLCPNVCLV